MDTCTKSEVELKKYIETILGTTQRYVLVSWPEIQEFMDHPRWSECIFCEEIEGHPCPDNSYMVPEEMYLELYNTYH